MMTSSVVSPETSSSDPRAAGARVRPCLGPVGRAVVWTVLLIAVVDLHGASPIDEAQSTLKEWIAARKSIAQAKAKWETDKETINQTIQLYQRELQSVEEKMSNLSTNNVQVEKERAEAEASIKESEAALEKVRQFAIEFEVQLKNLVPRLPGHLREDILKKFLDRLPSDPNKTDLRVTDRFLTLVSILNEIDKFNNAVTIFPDKRANAKGEEIAVETVYVGLGAAYFVNDSSDFAGMGSPGPDGWERTIQSDIAPQVREIIRVYKNERTARFVALPAIIR